MGGSNSKTGASTNQVQGTVTQKKDSSVQYRQQNYSIPSDILDQIADAPLKTLTTHTDQISDYLIQIPLMRANSYNQAIGTLQESGSMAVYQDTNFPARESSLTKDQKYFPRAEHIVWKRPSSFLDPRKTTNVFADALLPQDINIGHLGNYYFLSALSILSEQPKLIRRLYVSKDLNSYGCYSVWLNYDGEWTQILIDDQFPCEDDGPCFSQAKGPELWVNLIEKAYAQVFGSYDQLEVGLCGHAIRDLTGAPYVYYIRDNDTSDMNPDDVWKFIFPNLKQKNYIVIASTEKNERALLSEVDRMGITSILSYPVLDVFEFDTPDGSKERIIKLRNPWGQINWNGEYSEVSPKWTNNLKTKLKKQQNDNAIYLTVQEFIETFSQICVCKVLPEYLYNSYRIKNIDKKERKSIQLMTLRATQKTHGWISVCQRDRRNYSKNLDSRYEYSLFRIIVCGIENNGNAKQVGSYIGEGFECDRDIDVEVDLEPGQYVVYIDADWVQDQVRDFVVSSYTSKPIAINEITLVEKKNLQNNIIDDIIHLHQEKEDKERVQQYTNEIQRTSGSFCGYVYFYYENNSSKTVLKQNIKMRDKKAIDICAPYQNPDDITIEVKPGEKQICKFRVNQEARGEYSYSTNINYILLEMIEGNEDLMEKAQNSPSQLKQREMNGHLMDVFVHTYIYYGGVAFLYINQTRTKTYVEDLELTLQNLHSNDLDDYNKIKFEILPGMSKLLNLQIIVHNQDISYATQMSYYLR